MTELNRAIYDIERCTCHVLDACRDCSKYRGTYTPDCMEQLLTDALKLLKEQEAEPQTVLFREDGEYCPNCSTITTRIMGVQKLHRGTRFCPYCGQAVKWDG